MSDEGSNVGSDVVVVVVGGGEVNAESSGMGSMIVGGERRIV